MLRNIRHERFAQGIARGLPSSTAYIGAGYKARGNSAEVCAARLLRTAKVAARLDELSAKLQTAAIADAEEIQAFFTSVMRGKSPDGADLTEDHATPTGEVIELRVGFKDRVKAAELLARARGLFSNTSADAEGELMAIAQALAHPTGGRPAPN